MMGCGAPASTVPTSGDTSSPPPAVVPGVPYEPSAADIEAWESWYQTVLANSQVSDPLPVSVEDVRWWSSVLDQTDAQMQCWNEHGYLAEQTGWGEWSTEWPKSEHDPEFERMELYCFVTNAFHGFLGGLAIDSAEAERLYRYQIDVVVPCLEAQGYTVSEPPSFEVYAESIGTAEVWSPFTEVAASIEDGAIIAELSDACHASPPSDWQPDTP